MYEGELVKKNCFFRSFLCATCIGVLIVGCQPNIQSTSPLKPTDQVTESIHSTQPLTENKTMVCGRILHADSSPFNDLNVRLAEVYYGDSTSEGAFVLNTSFSPSAMTDDDGYFCTAEIAVTDYVLVIGNPEENYEIYSNEDLKPKVWTTTAGEVLDIGNIVTGLKP